MNREPDMVQEHDFLHFVRYCMKLYQFASPRAPVVGTSIYALERYNCNRPTDNELEMPTKWMEFSGILDVLRRRTNQQKYR